MNDEAAFRWAVLALVGATLPIGLYHHLSTRYGDRDRDYMHRTGKYLPRLPFRG